MNYTIKSIQFFVRETKPARFASALGKAGQKGKKVQRVTSPLAHVRMVIRDDQGNETFGTSADRLSVRWLDKRPGRDKGLKLRELVSLLEFAGQQYSAKGKFETPFAKWQDCHPKIMQEGRKQNQEELTAAFASALLERALLDGVSRLAGKPLFTMLQDDQLGFDPAAIHGEVNRLKTRQWLPRIPNTRISIRHTVGLHDPLSDEDHPRTKRINDGLPETVVDYIRTSGIRFFKVKISGDAENDLKRLARIWDILPHGDEPVVTLDANEAFDDLEVLTRFVKRLEDEQLGLFQHIAYIEQPLPRRLALDAKAARAIRNLGKIKPLIIDESDSALSAFRRALKLGYAGTSHKNCKGVFKSLAHRALVVHHALSGREVVLSGEDLQNLPIVPLHQDLVTVGILGLQHCERNGHHYNFGLSMLSEKDKASVVRHHGDLYEKRGDEWFLKIRDGAIQCASLHGPGFGVRDEPDWASMENMNAWLRSRYSA